jgi:LL-diaminopimelate aminotransferase
MRKAKRISNVPPYLFARIDKKKDELKAKGIQIIDLGVGDPDRPTFPRIVKKMHDAVDDASNHNYPPYQGTLEFRQAVSKWYKKRFNVRLDPQKEVLSLIGSKEGIAHVFLAFIDPGDIALIPDPAYPVYRVGTIFAGGTPHAVPLLEKNGFLPDFNSIDKKIAKKSKLLFINYPNNPTSAVADRKFLEDAVRFARENDLLLCSDLAYSEVSYDGYRPMSIFEIPGAKECAIEFHSLSKTYNMTGWRIGMAVGNEEAIAALSVIKTNIDSGAFKAIQVAAIEALEGDEDETAANNMIYQKRRDILVDGLNSLGWQIKKPKSTFYVWGRVPKGQTSESFCAEVLDKAGVLLVPGNGYGGNGEGYFRASITTGDDKLATAVEKMRSAGIRYR